MSPTPSNAADLRAWAYSDALEPQQDFDLLVTGLGHERLFVEWVADQACPKRVFFLGCLYLFVGDAVRTGFHTNSREEITAVMRLASDTSDVDLRRWHTRARELIADPDSFDYDLWCGGGYAGDAQ